MGGVRWSVITHSPCCLCWIVQDDRCHGLFPLLSFDDLASPEYVGSLVPDLLKNVSSISVQVVRVSLDVSGFFF